MQAFGFRKGCGKPKLRHIPVEHFAVCEAMGCSRAHGKALSSLPGPALMLLKKQRRVPFCCASVLACTRPGAGGKGQKKQRYFSLSALPLTGCFWLITGGVSLKRKCAVVTLWRCLNSALPPKMEKTLCTRSTSYLQFPEILLKDR